jgi:hypothetical protein
MTDHDERERLAAWLDAIERWLPEHDKDCARASAALLREPVDAGLLAAAKDALQYMLDGCPAPVFMGEPILKELRLAIAAAESAPRETPYDSMERAGAEQARRADQNQQDMIAAQSEVSHLTVRIAELEAQHESDCADYAIVKDNYGQALRNLTAAEADAARLTARVKELESKLYGEETDHVALMEAELARLRAAPQVGVEEVIARLGNTIDCPTTEPDGEGRWMWYVSDVERILRECWQGSGAGA